MATNGSIKNRKKPHCQCQQRAERSRADLKHIELFNFVDVSQTWLRWRGFAACPRFNYVRLDTDCARTNGANLSESDECQTDDSWSNANSVFSFNTVRKRCIEARRNKRTTLRASPTFPFPILPTSFPLRPPITTISRWTCSTKRAAYHADIWDVRRIIRTRCLCYRLPVNKSTNCTINSIFCAIFAISASLSNIQGFSFLAHGPGAACPRNRIVHPT